MSHTLATCSGLWCSTPPWSLKPHGAPPESVMLISSTTMLLCCLLDSGCRGRGHSLHLYMVPSENDFLFANLSHTKSHSGPPLILWSFMAGRSSKEGTRRERVATNVCLHGGILCCLKGRPTLVQSIKPDWCQRCWEGQKGAHYHTKYRILFLNVMDDRHINTLLAQTAFKKLRLVLMASILKDFNIAIGFLFKMLSKEHILAMYQGIPKKLHSLLTD